LDKFSTFILKLVVTAVIAASLSLALRGDPMNALAQGSDHPTGVQALRGTNLAAPGSAGDDESFAVTMIARHQGAVDAAKAALQHGDDAKIRALAERVIADEEKKIAEFRAWLAQRRP
jgi:uncharacterized protein (DUF305 family)